MVAEFSYESASFNPPAYLYLRRIVAEFVEQAVEMLENLVGIKKIPRDVENRPWIALILAYKCDFHV